VKQEMQLLQDVDKPGSDIDTYVTNLDSLLALKMSAIAELRTKLGTFKEHLNQEHTLSKKFFEQQNELNDVYDLHKPPPLMGIQLRLSEWRREKIMKC